MKNFILQAAKMLAGVRMLRCAMMLMLLCSQSAGAGEPGYPVSWGNGIFVGTRITLYCGSCHANTEHRVTQIISYPCISIGEFYAVCNSCKSRRKFEIKSIGSHDWADWKGDDTPATCTTPGGRYRTCGRCNTIEYEQPALRHDMSGWKTVAATCTTGGYEHNYCRRDGCDYEETRNQTAALGHDFALNHQCTRCDAVDPAKQPTGCLDNCAGGELQISLNGWAYDPNVPATPIDMHVYVYQNDGTTRYGDIHIIRANLQRPDLATALSIPTNHGYSTTIPIADAGTYKVKVYAIDLNGDGNPQIGATQTVTVGVPYIAANGQAQICNSATRLTGGEATTLSSGWYYAKGEVNYTGCLTLDGDANIILCDGATLNIGSSESRLTTHCILGQDYTLTVYGQGQQTGALYGYNKTSNKPLNPNSYYNPRTARVSQFTQYGGNVTFDLNVHSSIVSSPYPVEANVDYRGGHFTANGGYGIKGNVNINWNDPDDRFRTSGFGPNGTGATVTIAGGKAFTDGTNYYASTLDNTAKVGAQGRTLWPVTAISLNDNASNSTAVTKLNGVNSLDVTLSDRTLWKDGAWNTLCLPFDVSTTSGPLTGDNVKAMTLNTTTSELSSSTLTLNFTEATTIPAGTPFIIKWATKEAPAANLVSPVFTGVTISDATANNTQAFSGGSFKGSFSPVSFTANDKSILFLGAANKLYWPNDDMTLGACRAHFDLGTSGAPDMNIVLNFGDETTEIKTTNYTFATPHSDHRSENFTYSSDAWYTLSGTRLSAQPTKAGLYINNGKKVVVK